MRPSKPYVICWLWIFTVSLFYFSQTADANTNAWTKPTDGFWQEPFWSLGVLPDSSQSIVITNPGTRTVEINATTAQNFPSSLVVNDLLMRGSNTLVLNQLPANSPFQVLSNGAFSALNLGGGAVLRNWGSAMVVQQGRIDLGGAIYQEGGSFRATNAGMVMGFNSAYYLNDGVFEANPFFTSGSSFKQSGGQAIIPSLFMLAGTFHLADGRLTVRGTVMLRAESPITFIQDSGTNQTGLLWLSSSQAVGGSTTDYLLNGGLQRSDGIQVLARGTFTQNGGLCIVTNDVLIQGEARYYPPVPIPARVTVATNATFIARNLVVDNSYGFSFFSSFGTVSVSENIRFPGVPDMVSSFGVGGGLVSCSNLLSEGAVIDISQTGGNIIVTNSLIFAGYYPGIYSGTGARPAQYTFAEGTLTASNITLAAKMIVGSSAQSGRITNSGLFKMAGILEAGDANEPFLGRFQLLSNAVINLGSGAAKLAFAKSKNETWNEGVVLTITNWNGSLLGGGSDQLRFGSNASGLSPAQVDQIHFVNPPGLPAGTYHARILSTGEIVPRLVSIVHNPHAVVLSWDANLSLETSTNVTGPYVAVPAATSPYTNNFGDEHRYFRVHP